MIRTAVFFSVLILSACSKPSDFRLDAEHRKTFAAGRDLSKGEIIRIKVTGLGETERLRFHKCASSECKTAERIAVWNAAQVPSKGFFNVLLRESGKYYFWVEDFNVKYTAYDPDAVMVVQSSKKNNNGLELEYPSGLHVAVKLACQSKATTAKNKSRLIHSKAASYKWRRHC